MAQCFQGPPCSREEYCSSFSDRCEKCEDICDTSTHNYNENDCNRYCPAYAKETDFRNQLRAMQLKQNLILIVVLIMLFLVLMSKGVKLIRWLRKTRRVKMLLTNISSKGDRSTKEPTSGTIANAMHIHDIGRPPSQIYSATGFEGSTVLTVTTPVSTRYPGEDCTTNTDHSYDNAALQVTPSSNEPPFPRGVC